MVDGLGYERVAAEQRSELSPGRGFATPGYTRTNSPEPRSGERTVYRQTVSGFVCSVGHGLKPRCE